MTLQEPIQYRWRTDRLKGACERAGLTLEEAMGSSRYRNITRRRFHVMWICVREYGWSACETGRRLNREHSSILWGVNHHEKTRIQVTNVSTS